MDPEGYYARLGVAPNAAPSAIAAAFRAKARTLHPDVPVTGDAASFIRLREAYDVLSDAARRARYDRLARLPRSEPPSPPPSPSSDAYDLPPLPELPDFPVRERTLRIGLFAGLAVIGAVSVIELAIHLVRMADAPPPFPAQMTQRAEAPSARPPSAPSPAEPAFAATLSPVGTATHYVLPAGGPATLWRFDTAHNGYLPAGRLKAFDGVSVIDAPLRDGMAEIRVAAGQGFVDANRLTPGDTGAARRAYCGYSAGAPLLAGEVLFRHGWEGGAALTVENKGPEMVVLKLRDSAGASVVGVAADPGLTRIGGIAPGAYTVEYATGTLWSRACGGFVAGERPWRLPGTLLLAGPGRIAIPASAAVEIRPEAFSAD
jgi:curved DNA-binding protein CbpA